ncbi:MAG: hypothetical protein Q8O88_04245 [bacterium]|nr:hypothetical protein [bacterium]
MANTKTYKIKKGKHLSGFRVSPIYNKKVSIYEVIFTKSCIYNLGNSDQLDVNKLFGISFGYHHTNSARFGWRAEGDKIQISVYCYKNGKRYMKDMCLVDINKTYSMTITNIGNYYEFEIKDTTSAFYSYAKISKPKTPKFGYKLWPYFGGNEPAPHDVEILMKKIK